MLSATFQTIQGYLLIHPVLAPVMYVMAHVLLAVCLIPCSPMAIIAGVLWGKWLGLAISIGAAFLSSCTTFTLARLLMRQKIHDFLAKRYAKMDWFMAQTQKQGWKFVAAVQLNPAAPGSSLGYLFGLTGIDFKVYASFLLLFMLPLQWVLVTCGDSFLHALHGQMSVVMMVACGLLIGYLFYGLRNEQKQ